MQTQARRKTEGIEVRHKKSCRTVHGGACNCRPSFRAKVMRDGQLVKRTFPSRRAAKSWLAQATLELERGVLRQPSSLTLAEAARQFVDGARDGSILNRKGARYKPASIRGYERGLRLHVLPALGHQRLTAVRRRDVQDLVDGMVASGLGSSTVRNVCDPLRRIFDRALKRDVVAIDPTDGIEWPGGAPGRDRIASPAEAERLLAALPADEKALWATAIYAGLRRGELRALRWPDIDLDANVIAVSRSWDDVEGEQQPKSEASRRRVPLIPSLRKILVARKLAVSHGDAALVFGTDADTPFDPSAVRRTALSAWERQGLAPISLHECRHTFVSLMIASGINVKEISTFVGHGSVSITLDRYGHLLPGAEADATSKLQAMLDNAVSAAASASD